jgi:hypothetical protein
LFTYKDGELYWQNCPKTNLNGTKAGYLNNTGYLRVKINQKGYLIHRLIYVSHHGYLPKMIDHINGNPLDNRIENLREATSYENQYNAKARKDNYSGIKGIGWNKTKKKWIVRIRINGVRKHLGAFEDLELAELVILEARDKYHKEFARNE